MFIKYKPQEPHVKTIPVVITSGGGEAIPLASDSVILRPGVNELTEKEWEAIKPHVQDEINHKIIVPFTIEVKKAGGVVKARTLKDVPVSVARKIIESCQNVSVLKKWVRQELPDEIMLLVLKRFRKLKIDPDEDGDDKDGEEDTLEADITPEGGGEPEPEAGAETPKDDDDSETGGEGGAGKRRGRKGGGKKTSRTTTPEPEDDDDEIPDFDGSGGKE
jgi:hypothetical protein